MRNSPPQTVTTAMIKIVSIEKQGSRSLLTLESGESLTIAAAALRENHIKEGTEIPYDVLFEIKDSSDRKRARERALYILDARDHSREELYRKLRRNYSEEVCREVCDNLEEAGIIDDSKYAVTLAKYLVINKKMSLRRAKFEMAKRGIEKYTAEEALSEYDDGENERLSDLVERRYSRYLTDKKGFMRVRNALARQGYSFDDIAAVLGEYNLPEDE